MAASEEALLTGSVRLGAYTEARLEGNAYVMTGQPDYLVDMNGEYVLDMNGDRILLGVWNNGQLQGFLEVDLGVVEAALPRLGVRQQIADLEVWIETTDTSQTFVRLDVLPDIEVSRQLGAPSRFSFSLPYRKRNPLAITSSTRPLPAVQGSMGNPTGLRRIKIQAAYLTDEGVVRIPLLRGRAQEASLSYQDGASVLTLSGGDHWATMENRIEAGFSLPPGHGIPRGIVAQMLAEHGHGWSTSLWTGTTMYHDLQVVNEEVMTRIAEIADADNRLLFIDPEAVLTAPPEVDTSSPVVMVLGPRDWVRSEGIEVSGPGANPPTRVHISGQQQVLREETGVRTVERITKAYALYRVKVALASQDSAGSVSSTGAVESEEVLELVNQTTTRLTYDGDTLLVEETEVEAWYNPETWRYQYVTDPDGVDGAGDFSSYHDGVYFYDAATAKNDAEPAYAWSVERFVLVGRQTSTHTYDERNLLVKTETVKHGWLTIQQSIKSRANKSITWEATNHLDRKILANGIALASGEQLFAGSFGGYVYSAADQVERTTITYGVTDDGYITSTITTREAWDSQQGSQTRYLYGDGTERDTDEYGFIEVERTVEAYSSQGSEGTRRVTTRTGLGGKLLEVLDEPVDGYFPVATQRVDIEPDESIYAGREDLLAQARAASRRESKAIVYDLTSGALETRYSEAWLREEHALAESVADLQARAETRLALHSAIEVKFTVLFNALLKPGVRVHLRAPEIDLDDDVHVIAVSDQRRGRDQPLLTRVTGRIYVA